MSLYSRRDFLTTSGLALGASVLGAQTLSAKECGNHSAVDLLEEQYAGPQLKLLAASALDAAKQDGASYADIRISHQQTLSVYLTPAGLPIAQLGSRIAYGIRTMVNGAMAFNYGDIPTVDAVTAVAKNAVTQARGFMQLSIEKTEMAAAPVVTGEWATPFEIDPFTVPILEQGDLLSALRTPVSRVESTSGELQTGFGWEREARICATTDGSITQQKFQRAIHGFSVISNWHGQANLAIPEFQPRFGGYETVTGSSLPDRVKEEAERVQRYARLPIRQIDVGRYPVVLDGSSTAMMLTMTLGQALQMDRVLGLESDASGGSFMAPHAEALEKRMFSPHLSVMSGRPLDKLSGAKWDDECVMPETFPVITNGRVMDFITDRQTSPALAVWYKSSGKDVKSHGYAVAGRVDRPVMVGAGRFDMSPAKSQVSLEDLCRDIKRGVLMVQARQISLDQQLSSGFLNEDNALLLEIKNGEIVSNAKGVGLQFRTIPFWNSLAAVGDVSTASGISTQLNKGQPWQTTFADTFAPASLFPSIDVIAMGRP